MDNLNRVGNEGHQFNLPLQEDGLTINHLPVEIFIKIFSSLDDKDIQRASLATHSWNVIAVDTVARNEFSKVKKFADFLSKSMPENSSEATEQLFAIGSDRKILNSISIMQVKSSINVLHDQILKILINLNENDLNNLEELSKNEPKPKSYEHIFALAKIYKKLEEADQLEEFEKNIALKEIPKQLASYGRVDKALEVAAMMTNKFTQSLALKEISAVLIENGNFDKAEEVAKTIKTELTKDVAFRDLAAALTRSGNFQRATDVSNMIENPATKEWALRDIHKAKK